MTSPTVGLIFYLLYLVSLLLRRERRGFSGTEDISHSYIYGWGGYLYKGRNWAAEILAIAKGIQMISELQLAILESDSAAAWHLLLKNADISNPYLIKMGWLYWSTARQGFKACASSWSTHSEKAINVQTTAMALYEEEETKTLEVNPWSTLSQSW